jgi:hypothetical protein
MPKQKSRNTEAKATGGQTQTLKELVPIAAAINAALDKAAHSEQKAVDFRLTAAQHLADAKARCGKAKITFQDWCRDHLTYSYDEARKLAVVGASPEPAKALEDMRADAAKRNKAARARAKAAKADTAATDRPSSRATADGPVRSAPASTEAANRFVSTLHSVEALPDHERQSLVAELARTGKVTGVGNADNSESASDAIRRYWNRLPPSARAGVLETLAKDIGAEIVWPKGPITNEAPSDPFHIEENLRRPLKRQRRKAS